MCCEVGRSERSAAAIGSDELTPTLQCNHKCGQEEEGGRRRRRGREGGRVEGRKGGEEGEEEGRERD